VSGSVSGEFYLLGTALDNSSNKRVAFYGKRIPAGTVETITVALSVNHTDCAIGIWNITGQTSDTPALVESVANPATLALSATKTNAIVALSYSNDNAASVTWSGDVTEDFDLAVGNSRTAGAHGYSAAAGAKSVTTQWVSSVSRVTYAALWQ
jgi:hypothetical protein